MWYHQLYRKLPFKKQAFQLIRNWNILPPKVFRHLHFEGIFSFNNENGVKVYMCHYGSGFAMETDHFWMGEKACEPFSISAWIYFAQQCDVILDVGANTGTYSLIAASYNSTADIHAFEANKNIAERILINSEINSYNITTHPVAVSNQNGIVSFSKSTSPNDYIAKIVGSDNKGENVPSVTLDSFLPNWNISTTSKWLIKLDVEGHEPEVLLGALEVFKQHQPVFLLEVLTDDVAIKLNQEFNWSGYRFFDIDEEKGYSEISVIKRSSGNNILCVPSAYQNSQLSFLAKGKK
ncbi:MAG: FkbM family methyltransferase [Cytophagaceae bacterium]